jgi:hypothetical protein
MTISDFKNWKSIFSILLISIWVLVAVWAVTEPEPPRGRGRYGNVMTLQDQASADAFGVASPGIYVVNKNHKPVTAVRGGLGMFIRGVFTGDGAQASVGSRGLEAGLTNTVAGVVLIVLVGLTLLGLVMLLLPFVKRTAAPGSM